MHLRPLSDLTKEIEVNGEKFVPIEKLLDIHSNVNWSASDYLEVGSSHNDEWWVSFKKKPSFYFGFNKIHGFYAMTKEGNQQSLNNVYELYQKLFEWHFDVFGLIDAGLAIDINTLK